MESVFRKEMRKRVERIDSQISTTDPRLSRTVRIIHEEGTELIFESAFLLMYEGWVIIITEHHGPHFYEEEDLIAYMQYERLPIEEYSND